MDEPLCKNCVHFRERIHPIPFDPLCKAPESNAEPNLLYGGLHYKTALSMRSEATRCGPTARWFVAKPPSAPAPAWWLQVWNFIGFEDGSKRR